MDDPAHHLPMACALLGILLLGVRMRHAALLAAALGLVWMVSREFLGLEVTCTRRRGRARRVPAWGHGRRPDPTPMGWDVPGDDLDPGGTPGVEGFEDGETGAEDTPTGPVAVGVDVNVPAPASPGIVAVVPPVAAPPPAADTAGPGDEGPIDEDEADDGPGPGDDDGGEADLPPRFVYARGPTARLPSDDRDAGGRLVGLTGEIVEDHCSMLPKRRRVAPLGSPDLQVMDRRRLPVAMLPQAQRLRLHRVQGVPTHSVYRSTTGQTSSFAHLR